MVIARPSYSFVTQSPDESRELAADVNRWARVGGFDVVVTDQQTTVLVQMLPQHELNFKRRWPEFKPT